MQNVKEGLELFATEYCEEAIEEAKAYINRFGLTKKKIKIVKSDNTLIIRAITDFKLEESGKDD